MKQSILSSSQTDLFTKQNQQVSHQVFDLKDADVSLYQGVFSSEKSDEIFRELLETVDWQQHHINYSGNLVLEPRLMCLYGERHKRYSYSGVKLQARDWFPLLLELKQKVEDLSHIDFNSVLINQYRNEKDSVSWHSDREVELGRSPIIASLSFGASRRFMLKHKTDAKQKLNILLESGSFLLMKGETQHYWLHQVPKENYPISPRINLTFRQVF